MELHSSLWAERKFQPSPDSATNPATTLTHSDASWLEGNSNHM